METQMPLKLLTNTLTVLVGATLVAGMLSVAPVAAFDTGGGGGSSGGYGGSSDSSPPGAASAPSLNDARALIRAKKWKSAASALRQIVRTDPRNADANNLLGYALRQSGDYKTAQGFYLKALKLNPQHKGANEYLGELYVEIGQLAKANKQLATLEKLCGNQRCEEYQALARFIAAKG